MLCHNYIEQPYREEPRHICQAVSHMSAVRWHYVQHLYVCVCVCVPNAFYDMFSHTVQARTTYATRAVQARTTHATRTIQARTTYATRTTQARTTYATRTTQARTTYATRTVQARTTYVTRTIQARTTYVTRTIQARTTYATRCHRITYHAEQFLSFTVLKTCLDCLQLRQSLLQYV
jgi:hypothetical protein